MRPFFVVILAILTFSSLGQIKPEDTQPLPKTEAADSLSVIEIDPMADEKNAIYSAVIPGWGQVRNKQYIKAGAILGGFSYGMVNVLDKRKEFKTADKNYQDYLLNYDAANNNIEELNSLWEKKQSIRSEKDIWTAATTYIYVGNLIDAAAQYKILREEEGHSATKAAYYSAILPGLGQAYNKKYWKIPLVYAALGGSLYVARQNRNYHRDYEREIQYRSKGLSTGFRTLLPTERLEESVEYWRKWRDAAYIATGVVYVLNIVDATVDAHLFDFNVDDELNIDASPVFSQMNGEPYYAVQFNIPIQSKKK